MVIMGRFLIMGNAGFNSSTVPPESSFLEGRETLLVGNS